MSHDFAFHQAAHSARQLWVKYHQQSIALNTEWEKLSDDLDEMKLTKEEKRNHPLFQELKKVSAAITEADRQAAYYKQSYQEAVSLY